MPRFASIFLVVFLWGCGGATQKATGLRIVSVDETLVEVRESGAVILQNRQVAEVSQEGKVIASDGRLVAWLHGENIRLSGGAEIPIKEDVDGTLYLMKSAQEGAGLRTTTARMREDGRLERGGHFRVKGVKSDRDRRMALFLLLALENDLFAKK